MLSHSESNKCQSDHDNGREYNRSHDYDQTCRCLDHGPFDYDHIAHHNSSSAYNGRDCRLHSAG